MLRLMLRLLKNHRLLLLKLLRLLLLKQHLLVRRLL
jgi:hypothetical protein